MEADIRFKAYRGHAGEGGLGELLHQSMVECLIFKAYAHALERIPLTLASTAGLQPLHSLDKLSRAHYQRVMSAVDGSSSSSNHLLGIEAKTASITDTGALGVWEPLAAKISQIALATEGAVGVLRVDDILRCRALGGGRVRE